MNVHAKHSSLFFAENSENLTKREINCIILTYHSRRSIRQGLNNYYLIIHNDCLID